MQDITKIHSNVLSKLPKASVLVIGDIMLDRFTYGDVMRISPEAPVPVLHVNHEENYLGGAGNVARNISTLLGETATGSVALLGIIGSDKSGEFIRNAMFQSNISQDMIITADNRSTITKNRIVANSQQIVRIDEEDLTPYSDAIIKNVETLITDNIDKYEVIILSDYGKGVINKNTAKYIIDLSIKNKKSVLVDPHIKHFPYYKHATLITPNLKEALEGMGDKMLFSVYDNEKIKALGEQIKNKLELKNLLITLGANGMALFSDSIKQKDDKAYIIPTKAKSVFDVSGAGDTVIAVMGMCMSVGLNFIDSASIANVAAGIVVGKRGTSTLTLDELYNAI